jgi:hypothetical protein
MELLNTALRWGVNSMRGMGFEQLMSATDCSWARGTQMASASCMAAAHIKIVPARASASGCLSGDDLSDCALRLFSCAWV